MRVVGDTELVGDSEQERVGLGDGGVFAELFDQGIGLGGVAAAEDGARIFVEETNRVLFAAAAAEVGAIAVVNQGEDAAADGYSWSARVARLFPRGAKGTNLRGLLNVE